MELPRGWRCGRDSTPPGGAARAQSAERSTLIRDVEHGGQDGSECWPELYQEIGRLPERFRQPILLCHIEGLTHEQAAARLGCPVRTVQSRLARARERLRTGLGRRGVAPAVAALTRALDPDVARTVASNTWKQATVTAAVRYSTGGTAAALVPSTVALLAQAGSRAMSLHYLMKWLAALLLMGVALGGAGFGMRARSASTQPERRPPDGPNQPVYSLRMAGDVTFEVIAVSSFPSGPKSWWRPDGTPLDEPPCDPLSVPFPRFPDQERRIVLARVDLPKDANLRWLPTFDGGSTGLSPARGGQNVPGLEAYIVSLRPDRATCEVTVRLAAGPWKTEVSNDGRGGRAMVINGHNFSFGKARPFTAHGRPMTAFAVAHNFFGQDRRLVAVDHDGTAHAAVSYSASSDGDKKSMIDIIDAEFPLPPDQIKEYQVQFRPFEIAEIKGIALNPRSPGKPISKTESPPPETGPTTVSSGVDPTVDSDGDGLSDFQEIHKYRTDPRLKSTAGDGVADGDRQRRREFTYSVRSVVKVMPPVNLECLDDDYQDARVLSRSDKFVELEVIHYPLNTNADAIRGNPAWRRDAESKQDYLRPGITTNWDETMRGELIAALKADGIDPDQLDDKQLVSRASGWLLANTKYINMFCTHYMHFPDGRAAIYPGLEARFEREKGDRSWSVEEQLGHELFGRSMFANRTHGSCTSWAVFQTTALRALGIPTRMVLGIPMVDGNDPAQLAMISTNIHHHRVRRTLLQGLSQAKGYANHTFNEVFVGGRWVRLNYKTLGQNSLDGNLMGLLTHVNTFNDLADVPLAATWGKRYAKGERDDVFLYGNPYRCDELSDHFGRFAKVENPEPREHRALDDQPCLLGRRS